MWFRSLRSERVLRKTDLWSGQLKDVQGQIIALDAHRKACRIAKEGLTSPRATFELLSDKDTAEVTRLEAEMATCDEQKAKARKMAAKLQGRLNRYSHRTDSSVELEVEAQSGNAPLVLAYLS